MEYSWHVEDAHRESNRSRLPARNQVGKGEVTCDVVQGPGLIDELEAFMGPASEGCYLQPIDVRRVGGHQLPESPPDSSSENPYSPETQVSHTLAVSQTILGADYMLVPEHINLHEVLQHNGEYIYEEIKDNLEPEALRTPSDVLVLPDEIIRNRDVGMPDYQNRYMRVDMPEQGLMTPQLVAALSPETATVRPPPSVDGSEAGDDAPLQCIRFSSFQQNTWHSLFDANLKPIPTPTYVVGADKGFNFSQIDEAFVCQKKNHFQVTCQIQAEDPCQEVRIEQSQSDRTKKPFHPVPVDMRREGTKITVGRLHFAETTNNNMRKKGRPNPDQRHFQLVVALKAHVQHSQRFESDCSEGWWQRGVSENSVHFSGRVGINTDRPDESCVINVHHCTCHRFNYDPSFAEHSGLVGWDRRSSSRDTGVLAQEVRRVIPDAVKEAGDVALPNGDTIPKFLVVNKDRIFMENLGAVKELCKVTGHLESRIDQLEKVNRRLCKIGALQRRDSARSCGSSDSRLSGVSTSSKSLYSDGNISIEQIRDIARSIRRHECCHKLSHNSPKYTRKQCKNCHASKYGKYYNYNKTSVRYHSKGLEKPELPTYVGTLESDVHKVESPVPSTKKDGLWLRDEENFGYGNVNTMAFCCRKSGYEGNELVSNKFLQVVITILIFIMAVCLVVMSALYFREHQELLTMKEIRMHEKFSAYPHFGKLNANAPHRATPPDLNQIHNSKPQHTGTKKTNREKVPHKSPEYTSLEPPLPSPTTIHASRNYVKNILHMEQSTAAPRWQGPMFVSRVADVIGSGCTFTINTDNELDAECQSSCGLDSPQTYENQEPLERTKPEKELNETFVRPLEPAVRDKIQIPIERNHSESKDKDFKKEMKEEIIAESNFLENKNVSEVRLRRECKYDTAKNCQLNRDIARPVPGDGGWNSRISLECNLDRRLRLRAHYETTKELCYLNVDSKNQFIEFNIHIYRDCHN
ncbi:unnamed protein product [Leptidea sinapis]|uniref:NDT80 domain-containing protein n=1 Tax=Leptidea sinapis TaxID=189913 RepID=A0A5E4QYA4_9NEOP|nr:unnamed protein product [Leptidea sinapis]